MVLSRRPLSISTGEEWKQKEPTENNEQRQRDWLQEQGQRSVPTKHIVLSFTVIKGSLI